MLANRLPAVDVLRLDAQLCSPVCVASRLMLNAYRPLLDEFGITYPQDLVLLVLWEHDGLSVGALGERLHLDTGTIAPLLKRMEKLEIVVRQRSTEDERVVLNWLTPKARDIKPRPKKITVTFMCGAGIDLDELPSLKVAIEGLIAKLLPLQEDAGNAHDEGP